uniref:Uncharacterized protein n=1 Tax=Arundo donax TaxID=35708 RepID=A0A0A8XTL3_ARUDO
MQSASATAASYISAPSPSSFAAYIQLPLALTSARDVTLAQTKLVNASPTASLAMALGLSKPFIGCSPMAQAPPVRSVYVCAITATSLSGSWRGPTVCCCATRPVTHLSTFVVKKRFEHMEGSFKTRLRTSISVTSGAMSKGSPNRETLLNSKVF